MFMDSELILARIFSLLIRASLKDTWAPGASPRVDLMEHALLSLSRHCLIRYDLGMPFTSIFSSWMKASPTENLSMRYRTFSTFSLSASDRLPYCLFLLCSFWDACNWASSVENWIRIWLTGVREIWVTLTLSQWWVFRWRRRRGNLFWFYVDRMDMSFTIWKL